MSDQPQRLRTVHLLTADQLKRKREGDRNAQRLRREKLKVELEMLQGRVAELEARNRYLEETSAAAVLAPPPQPQPQPPAVAADSDTGTTSVFPSGNGDPRQDSYTVGSGLEQRGWTTSEPGSTLSTATSTRFEGGGDGDGHWEELPPADSSTETTSNHEFGALGNPDVAAWAHGQPKHSVFQIRNDDPLGLALPVWTDPSGRNDAGPGGLPLEYAAAIESTSLLAGNDHDARSNSNNNNKSREGFNSSESAGESTRLPSVPTLPPYSTLACNQVWAAIPKHTAPSCLVDRVVLDLIRHRRLQDNVCEFIDRPFPSIQSLLNPHLPEHGTLSPVTSSIVNNIIHLTNVPTLPEQVAILYVMSSVIRWQISPTEAHYDAMPVWLRPGAAQLIVPHTPWIDLLPWPRVRERMCRNPQYHDRHALMSQLCNESLSINWPYYTEDILLHASGEEPVLNPVFYRHIQKIENWTVGVRILEVFRELKGEVNIR